MERIDRKYIKKTYKIVRNSRNYQYRNPNKNKLSCEKLGHLNVGKLCK